MKQSVTPEPQVEVSLELAVANARLETEVLGLKEILRLHREQVEDLRTERDRLMAQVESANRLLTHVQTSKKWRWFGWRSAS